MKLIPSLESSSFVELATTVKKAVKMFVTTHLNSLNSINLAFTTYYLEEGKERTKKMKKLPYFNCIDTKLMSRTSKVDYELLLELNIQKGASYIILSL